MSNSLGFKVDGTVFSESVLPSQPEVVSRARVFQLLGVDMISSVKNWTHKTSTSAIGAPIYASGYADLSGVNGFESADAASSGNFTHLIVSSGNIGSTANLGLMGRWQTGATQDMVYFFNNNSVAAAVNGALRASVIIPGTIPELKFVNRLMGARYNGATARALYSDAGAIGFTDAAYVGGSPVAAKLRIGATNFPTSGSAFMRMSAAISWNFAITDQEIQDVYDYLKALITARGGVVA
jgi:hypothetical protein